MKEYEKYFVWLLIVGGLLLGYQGIAHQDFLMSVLGPSIGSAIDIIIGVAALVVGYSMVSKKKKR